jgi:hypothetical protein
MTTEPMDDPDDGKRLPYWELHIQPMFRALDREHMLTFVDGARKFDLFDYDQVVARADKILRALKRPLPRCMPFPEFGGPWPEEWIELFARWQRRKFPRLGRGAATSWDAVDEKGVVTLSCKVRKRVVDETWLDRVGWSEPREYALYLEPGPEGTETEIADRDISFPAAAGVSVVIVHDATGVPQQVPIRKG